MPLHFGGRMPTSGQLPSLQSYTQFLLFFADPGSERVQAQREPNDIDTRKDGGNGDGAGTGLEEKSLELEVKLTKWRNEVLETLRMASRKVVERFPWLGGKIGNTGHRYEPKQEGDSGLFEVLPNLSAGTDGGRQIHIVSRERFNISYDSIIHNRGPTSLLKSELFTQKKLMPETYDLSETAEPVLAIEVTFLRGGVVVCFSALHLGLDMTGLGEVVGMIGRACRGESVNEEEEEEAAGDVRMKKDGERNEKSKQSESEKKDDILKQEGKVKGENDDEDAPSIPDWKSLIIKKPPTSTPLSTSEVASPSTRATWKYIHFSASNLAKLKSLASPTPSSTSSKQTPWVSTNDALTAFLWHRILLARLPRLPLSASQTTTLTRALNARRYLSPPRPKKGIEHCVSCTYTTFPLSQFTTSPSPTPSSSNSEDLKEILPPLALSLRTSIKTQANTPSLNHLTNILTSTKDKSTLSFGATLHLHTTDVLFSSGAGVGIYSIDFGPFLGKPQLVRRPWVDCVDGGSEGIGYFMPMDLEGGIDVVVCLRGCDWEGLEGDGVFGGLGVVIG